MQGIQYDEHGGVDVLHLANVRVPDPAPNEVLVRIHAASLNPFDWKLRNGGLRGIFDVALPVRPGRDGCGEVVSVAEQVSAGEGPQLHVGQRVCFMSSRLRDGTMAEYAAVQAADFVAPAPETLSDEQCAALPLVGLSAWSGIVDTARVQPGMKVLIHGGSGGVGSMAVQLARHLGAEVHATCSHAKARAVEALGGTAIPYDRVDFTEVIADCDVVFDTVGGAVHERSYEVLKQGGCLAYLIAKPFAAASGRDDVKTRQVVVSSRAGNLRAVAALAAGGVLVPQVAESLPLANFRDAFTLAESGHAEGKVVLTTKVG